MQLILLGSGFGLIFPVLMFRKYTVDLFIYRHFLWAWISLAACGFHIFPQFTFRRSERSEEFKQKISPRRDETARLIAPGGAEQRSSPALMHFCAEPSHLASAENRRKIMIVFSSEFVLNINLAIDCHRSLDGHADRFLAWSISKGFFNLDSHFFYSAWPCFTPGVRPGLLHWK